MGSTWIIRRLRGEFLAVPRWWVCLLMEGRQAKLVTSKEGVKLREKVWGEILEVLTPVAPEIRKYAKANM